MPNQERSLRTLQLKRFFMRRICPRRLHRHLPRSVTTNVLPGIPGRIHTWDAIPTSPSQAALDDYLAVGRSALENCEATLAAIGRSFADVRTCLDLPCGHGRVLRWLGTRINPAGITACDIDRAAVDFCREEFGVTGVYSSDDLDRLALPDEYDLIWVGSLLTHLDPQRCIALLRRTSVALRKGGVLIFTTHGESCLKSPGLSAYGKRFHVLRTRMETEFHRDGWCYEPYDDCGYYGITLHSEGYVKKLLATQIPAGLQLVRFQARGWHDHQDVWSFRRP
jgi:SAM-dependent methyltransferase